MAKYYYWININNNYNELQYSNNNFLNCFSFTSACCIVLHSLLLLLLKIVLSDLLSPVFTLSLSVSSALLLPPVQNVCRCFSAAGVETTTTPLSAGRIATWLWIHQTTIKFSKTSPDLCFAYITSCPSGFSQVFERWLGWDGWPLGC